MNRELIDYIAKVHSVSRDHLAQVSCRHVAPEVESLAKAFVKIKQCFSNSLNMSMVDGCDVVIGYAFLNDYMLPIEHAWNSDQGTYFDLTAQLFWNNKQGNVQYFELLRISSDEAVDVFNSLGGIDHMALRKSSKHKYLFGL